MTYKEKIRLLLAILIGAIMGGVLNHVRVAGTASTGTEAYYHYTVGRDIAGYVDGQETRTFKLYQRALCVTEDGKPGWDTATATMFFNAQRDMGLGIK